MIHKESNLVVFILNLHSEINLSLFKERAKQSGRWHDHPNDHQEHVSISRLRAMIKDSILAVIISSSEVPK